MHSPGGGGRSLADIFSAVAVDHCKRARDWYWYIVLLFRWTLHVSLYGHESLREDASRLKHDRSLERGHTTVFFCAVIGGGHPRNDRPAIFVSLLARGELIRVHREFYIQRVAVDLVCREYLIWHRINFLNNTNKTVITTV